MVCTFLARGLHILGKSTSVVPTTPPPRGPFGRFLLFLEPLGCMCTIVLLSNSTDSEIQYDLTQYAQQTATKATNHLRFM